MRNAVPADRARRQRAAVHAAVAAVATGVQAAQSIHRSVGGEGAARAAENKRPKATIEVRVARA
jgi:hypothetical protein